jgi:hypothetical protein
LCLCSPWELAGQLATCSDMYVAKARPLPHPARAAHRVTFHDGGLRLCCLGAKASSSKSRAVGLRVGAAAGCSHDHNSVLPRARGGELRGRETETETETETVLRGRSGDFTLECRRLSFGENARVLDRRCVMQDWLCFMINKYYKTSPDVHDHGRLV